jgi:DNA replication protein DnaC
LRLRQEPEQAKSRYDSYLAEQEAYLFEIVMRRHELKSTMMTSNRPIEDWGKLIGDVPSATAILDRFLHRSEVIQISGCNYRLGTREINSKRAKAPIGSPTDEAVEH